MIVFYFVQAKKFFLINVSISIFSAARDLRLSLSMSPEALKRHSDAILVEGALRYLLASFANKGN